MNTPPNPDDENDIRLLASVLQDIDPVLVLKATSVHLLNVHAKVLEAINAAAHTLRPVVPTLRKRADEISVLLSKPDHGMTVRECTTLAAELVRLQSVLDVLA
jgi:hypothetical protein